MDLDGAGGAPAGSAALPGKDDQGTHSLGQRGQVPVLPNDMLGPHGVSYLGALGAVQMIRRYLHAAAVHNQAL